MGNATDARVDRPHLPDWRWVPRTVHLHILLTCPNANLLRQVGSPAQLVLRSYVVATKGLEDVNAGSIRPHGGLDRRVGAVLFHEDVGGAEYVEVGDHSCRTRLTAARASEAVMSGRARWTARTASSVWLR